MNDQTINQIPSSKCTGCMTCEYVCSQKAITKGVNEQGFRMPFINAEKCINCGECYRKCPENNVELKKNTGGLGTYAVMADDDTRLQSSSGGAFTVLANYVLQNGGCVIGAVYEDSHTVVHEMISDSAGLIRLQKSKYVQSDISRTFFDIEKCLSSNTNVLFVGTPCQVAALKQVFEDSDKLLLVDILCMGVSSSNCLKKYLDEEFATDHVELLDFRYKIDGKWNQNLNLKIITSDGEKVVPFKDSSYFLAFLKGITLRPSCKHCTYAGCERVRDVTLGDFWGVRYYKKKLDDGKGTSLVMVNSIKGADLLEKIKKNFKLIETVPFDIACRGNATLTGTIPTNPKNDLFWKNYNSTSLRENLKQLLDDSADCGIINYWYTNDHGAILTAFALQQFLKKNGYSSKLINLTPPRYERRGGISEKFELKYLDSTYGKYNNAFLSYLNDKFKFFLVGSDQVFRAEWVPDNWFLAFVHEEKIKISISASFGIDKLNVSPKRKKKIRYLLNRFNNISVREKSGVEICRNLGVKSAEWILDPVFLIDKEIYIEIAQHEKKSNKLCFCYIRNNSQEINEQISAYAKAKKMDVVYCNEQMPVEYFIGYIYDCDILITDSYHGLCFGIIFRKNVFCYKNKKRGNARFDSLTEQLHLPEKIFIYDHKEKLVNRENIDFNLIEKTLEEEIKRSSSWIINCLSNPAPINKRKVFLYRCLQYSLPAAARLIWNKSINLTTTVKRKVMTIHE